MTSPPSPDSDVWRLITFTWVTALLLATSPWFAALLLGPRLEFLFTYATIAAVTALPTAGLGLFMVIRARRSLTVFIGAFAFLTINMIAVGLGTFAWFAIPSCGGGQTGPCMSPFYLLSGGLVATIIAVVLIADGLATFRQSVRRPPPPDT